MENIVEDVLSAKTVNGNEDHRMCSVRTHECTCDDADASHGVKILCGCSNSDGYASIPGAGNYLCYLLPKLCTPTLLVPITQEFPRSKLVCPYLC